MTEPAAADDLAARLEHLFATVRHPDGRAFTHEEVAADLRKVGGPTISATYLWQLRKGQRTNPRMSHLEGLARFFAVDPAYFFATELGETMRANLELAVAVGDPYTRRLAAVAGRLTPASRHLLEETSEHLLVLESRTKD